VIFFCGAGVSRARAGLSDFFGLAQKVIGILGVGTDDPPRRIIKEAREMERRTGIGGLIPADRVFGLLERSFLVKDIEAAVAMALRPDSDADLSAHRIMLDLAKGPDGRVRLVTTNFDTLFESCDTSLQCSRHPRLPDPRRHEEFEGIIHLHGHVDQNYAGAVGDGLVLSSSAFGRAYLSEGWATSFMKSILDRYVVVFVGYTADDPPVQYLLEALNADSTVLRKAYAFQAGSQGEAEAKWGHKGVRPIAYDESDSHKAFWDTLEAWAERARNPDGWHQDVIGMAQRGPEALLPHQRGQVAHVVSTLHGARKFLASTDPPPAEWLCVFDPRIRYSRPGYLTRFREKGPYFDPFDAYGMDDDTFPPKIDPEDHFARRDIPKGARNCLTASGHDRNSLGDHNFPTLSGPAAVNMPQLPERLWQLSGWIARVSNQPAAVWWASTQGGIHPALQALIRLELERAKTQSSAEVRRAWRYIFEARKPQMNDFYEEWYRLKQSIDLDGWTDAAVRQLAVITRPYIAVDRPFWGGPKPPENDAPTRWEDMVRIDVEYPTPTDSVQVPDQFLKVAIREFRKNLEHAVCLEKERLPSALISFCPIEPDPDLAGEMSGRTHGLARCVLFYVERLKKLIENDPKAAKQEYLSWWTDDDAVFARLRIWVCGYQQILSGSQAGRTICELSDEAFWDSHHRRDLLLVLAKRWLNFPFSLRKKIERRLLRGQPQWPGVKKKEYAKWRAWESLNRIHWLASQGCRFSFDLSVASDKLRKFAHEWQPAFAASAAASMESRGGFIQADTSYADLVDEPLGTLLKKAAETSGHKYRRLLESDPFKGLSFEKPIRAFLALSVAAKRNDYPEWAWRTFLNPEARKSDKSRLTAVVAERLCRAPSEAIALFLSSASDWLLVSAKVLLTNYPTHFQRLWDKVVSVLRSDTEKAGSSIVRGNEEPDWATEALNSPTGKLAQALMDDPAKNGLRIGGGFPASWIGRVEDLLALNGDARRYALVTFAFNLNWFYTIDPDWTDAHLISALDKEGHDQDAFWYGIFWSATIPNEKLYQRIKPDLLNLARRKSPSSQHHVHILSGFLLAGWGSTNQQTREQYVTNAEMREVLLNSDDGFRIQTLSLLRGWSSKEDEGRWRTKLPVFLKEVWPRDKKAKSPRISIALLDLVFSDTVNPGEIADIILPLISRAKQEHIGLYNLRKAETNIIERFPEKVLALLSAILPDDAASWAYDVEEVLERIGTADPSLLTDGRLVELKRRWNSR
jgi:hypothetical protein